jgi:phosphatidylglycerol lysyltransferase
MIKPRVWHGLLSLLGLGAFLLSGWVLWRELAHMNWQDILASLNQIPTWRVGLSVGLMICGYLMLTCYDLLGMRQIQQDMPPRRIMFASFLSYAFSNNVGLSVFGAMAMRLRLYTAWGVSSFDVGRLVVFTTTSFWLGLISLAGVSFTLHPIALNPSDGIPYVQLMRVGGLLLLTLTGLYLLACHYRRKPIGYGQWHFTLPPLKLALLQPAIGMLDWFFSAMTLYVILPTSAHLTVAHFLAAYLLAQVAGLISHVPGGIGVFESVMLLMLKDHLPSEQIISSIVLFRLIYYMLPLLTGAVLLGAYEFRTQQQVMQRIGNTYARWAGAITANIIAFLTFAAGVVLLWSGSTPAAPGRMGMLYKVIPLPAIELSHFLGSVLGAVLLVLARALQRRVNAAYGLTMILLALGVAISLIKGLDYEEAMVLFILWMALLPCKASFYRKASLLSPRPSLEWTISLLIAVGTSIGIGLFAYKNTPYTSDLWWHFDVHAHAGRFLRASAGAMTVLLIVGLLRLMRPTRHLIRLPDPDDLGQALAVISKARRSSAWLGMLGDKHLLFNAERDAFVMFAQQNNSWIAMGDPVGNHEAWPQLVWDFREQADQQGCRVAFYQVMPENLSLYADMGLTLTKLGEEALVPLGNFSLEGGSRSELRKEMRRAANMKITFEILPVEQTVSLLPQLKGISDQWLNRKGQLEKGFSLGYFNADYLSQTPVAVLRDEQRNIIAFANIWGSTSRIELSIDLMRYSDSAPKGIMRYLFTELMLYGQAQGYESFNLGMAPLSGMESHPLAPLWHQLARQAFEHGDSFYHFQGLRQFKDSFDPIWTPRYLAAPSGLQTPRVMVDLVQLISKTRQSNP